MLCSYDVCGFFSNRLERSSAHSEFNVNIQFLSADLWPKIKMESKWWRAVKTKEERVDGTFVNEQDSFMETTALFIDCT
jgi:hypothetical protein